MAVLFDQELLRLACAWQTPEGTPPVSLQGMAQISYAEPHRKAGKDFSKPANQPFLTSFPVPGIGAQFESLAKDARPFFSELEHGRGPIPLPLGRFDGTTCVTHGGVGAEGGSQTGKGPESRPKSSPFSGEIARISPGGKSAEVIATRAREPYFTLHPRTGMLTGTDQQGNFIPSSVCYLIRKGDDFGFGDEHPENLTPPLVWISHSEDNSSASQVWMAGSAMGALDRKIVHLSYGRGTPFLICPDLDAPTPQGAVIPLGLETDIPLLHARKHP